MAELKEWRRATIPARRYGWLPSGRGANSAAMSTTFTIDTSTSRANPTPAPMKRLTIPALRQAKGGTPLVMLTAYTVRTAQLLDPHCDLLLVGDSLGQVIYGLPSTVPVTLEMMAAHGAAVVRGSYHSVVIIDMPLAATRRRPKRHSRALPGCSSRPARLG